jgi:hypothetical protein
MRRRDLLIGPLAATCIGRPAAAAWSDGLLFRATRNGSPIGWHRILFRQDGDRLDTDIDIRLDVRVLLIPVFSYRHRNRERWQGTDLVGFDSETDDDGEKLRVHVERQGTDLVVDGSRGRLIVPEPLPPTTWWSRRLVGDGAWIETQRGIVVHSTVTSLGLERVTAVGRLVEAERLHIEGDIDLDIWYADDRWVKLEFTAEADGSSIGYELVAVGPAVAEASLD